MNNPKELPKVKVKYVRERIPLTTTARSGIVTLVNLDRTFRVSYSGVGGIGLRVDQPRLDIPEIR